MFLDFVAFYRSLLEPLHFLVNLLPLPIEIPKLAVDLAALYVVLVAMSWRATYMDRYLYRNIAFMKFAKAWDSGASLEEAVGRARLKKHSQKIVDLLRCAMLVPIFSLRVIAILQRIERTFAERSESFAREFEADEVALKALDDLFRILRTRAVSALVQFLMIPVTIIVFFTLNANAPSPN